MELETVTKKLRLGALLGILGARFATRNKGHRHERSKDATKASLLALLSNQVEVLESQRPNPQPQPDMFVISFVATPKGRQGGQGGINHIYIYYIYEWLAVKAGLTGLLFPISHKEWLSS